METFEVMDMVEKSLVRRARNMIFSKGTLEQWHNLNINGKVLAPPKVYRLVNGWIQLIF